MLAMSTATISPCGRYRYDLTRHWGPSKELGKCRVAVWCGLNPSTATAEVDDPTIRREVAFSKAWGYDGYAKVNAYAFRSTDPKQLWKQEDPMGPENLAHIIDWAKAGAIFVACWGNNIREKEKFILRTLFLVNRLEVHALKLTNQDNPSHPLYLRKDLKPFLWLGGDS